MNYLQNSFFKSVTWAGLTLAVIAGAFFLVAGQVLWSAAVLVSFCWMSVNCFFLFQIVRIGMNPTQKKNSIFLLSIIKFPVLYLVGFYILKSRYFPEMGILLGLTLYFVALLAVWIFSSFKQKSVSQQGVL